MVICFIVVVVDDDDDDDDDRYVDCEPDLMEFIKRKEMDGHVFWWRPHKSWELASEFFESLVDPARGHKFALTQKR